MSLQAYSRSHAGRGSSIPKFPPYSRRIDSTKRGELHVLTGTGAWERAASTTWFPGRKVVIQADTDPIIIDWSFARDFNEVVIWNFGSPASPCFVHALASRLLALFELVLHVDVTVGKALTTTRFVPKTEITGDL